MRNALAYCKLQLKEFYNTFIDVISDFPVGAWQYKKMGLVFISRHGRFCAVTDSCYAAKRSNLSLNIWTKIFQKYPVHQIMTKPNSFSGKGRTNKLWRKSP